MPRALVVILRGFVLYQSTSYAMKIKRCKVSTNVLEVAICKQLRSWRVSHVSIVVLFTDAEMSIPPGQQQLGNSDPASLHRL